MPSWTRNNSHFSRINSSADWFLHDGDDNLMLSTAVRPIPVAAVYEKAADHGWSAALRQLSQGFSNQPSSRKSASEGNFLLESSPKRVKDRRLRWKNKTENKPRRLPTRLHGLQKQFSGQEVCLRLVSLFNETSADEKSKWEKNWKICSGHKDEEQKANVVFFHYLKVKVSFPPPHFLLDCLHSDMNLCHFFSEATSQFPAIR